MYMAYHLYDVSLEMYMAFHLYDVKRIKCDSIIIESMQRLRNNGFTLNMKDSTQSNLTLFIYPFK